jgi:hypothetical protein
MGGIGMAETLGSLCDKLCIIKLKQWHSKDQEQLKNLSFQEKLLQEEINEYIRSAVEGSLPLDQLSLPANKVYTKDGDWMNKLYTNIGEVFSALALANCKLWHIQEKAYEFEKVPMEEKDSVIYQQSILNLERNRYIDEINIQLYTDVMNSRGEG